MRAWSGWRERSDTEDISEKSKHGEIWHFFWLHREKNQIISGSNYWLFHSQGNFFFFQFIGLKRAIKCQRIVKKMSSQFPPEPRVTYRHLLFLMTNTSKPTETQLQLKFLAFVFLVLSGLLCGVWGYFWLHCLCISMIQCHHLSFCHLPFLKQQSIYVWCRCEAITNTLAQGVDRFAEKSEPPDLTYGAGTWSTKALFRLTVTFSPSQSLSHLTSINPSRSQ